MYVYICIGCLIFYHCSPISKCTTQQGCRTGSISLAPGLQVPPVGTPDKEANLPSELNTPQPHLNRAQSITSAVDYEYFDVGIGQVALKLAS